MRVYKHQYKGRDGVARDTAKYYVSVTTHRGVLFRTPAYRSERDSESLGRRIEALVSCRIDGRRPDQELARWLEQVPLSLKHRLVKADLLDKQKLASGRSLTELLPEYGLTVESHEVSRYLFSASVGQLGGMGRS